LYKEFLLIVILNLSFFIINKERKI
jgi:hypothetical protein